ncbi:MAG: molybdopterin molybdotransferase MoeA [Acidilobaceae archaeon]|nr:molybdopterin molybdotransferase MoeA [Acidilobaceae archaeon]MCX8165161.1 molybdopterin molybdotransferase MoeA [Acidilobaceae archaeon]MDW7974323.1 molybdopterin molybdotransferase MoeA [Sulfolobales archaeon]
MSGFKELTSVAKAVEMLRARVTHRPGKRKVRLEDSLGRYLAVDVVAPLNIPPSERAVVDGYAVRSADTFGSSPSNPSILRVKGFLRAGEEPKVSLSPGEAVEVATGAQLPPGADAVVMYERTRRSGDILEVLEPVPPLGNVSRVGEDVREGEVVLRKGTRLMPWDIAVLASMGIGEVEVYDLRVGLLNVGSELVELGEADAREALKRGLVINSNRYSISALLTSYGFSPQYLGIVRDELEEIREALGRAVREFDAVITVGGASVGRADLTVRAARELGAEVVIHGVQLRPGRANSAAVVQGKPIFMLAGFPVAAIVGFEALAKPLLLHMVGGEEEPKATVKGVLTRRVTTPINVRSYVRVRVFEEGGKTYVEPLALTGSGILSTLVRGNGILVVPEDREGYDEGEEVEVVLLRSPSRTP